MDQQFNLITIWAHGDIISHAVAVILLLMSIISWTIMGISFLRQKKFKLQRRIAKNFWRNNSLEESIASIADDSSPWKILAQEGIYAAKGFDDYVEKDFRDPNAKADWIVRSLANVLDKMANSQNKGLTMLSSIGATSPFVGLFGTVWGIYHTLMALSGGGQMTIDQVAGPIGEALVMTAFGLFVAIPAVLGNNAISGGNSARLEEMGMFAQDIQTFLVTGQRPLTEK